MIGSACGSTTPSAGARAFVDGHLVAHAGDPGSDGRSPRVRSWFSRRPVPRSRGHVNPTSSA